MQNERRHLGAKQCFKPRICTTWSWTRLVQHQSQEPGKVSQGLQGFRTGQRKPRIGTVNISQSWRIWALFLKNHSHVSSLGAPNPMAKGGKRKNAIFVNQDQDPSIHWSWAKLAIRNIWTHPPNSTLRRTSILFRHFLMAFWKWSKLKQPHAFRKYTIASTIHVYTSS